MWRKLLPTLLLLLLAAAPALAQIDTAPKVHALLIPETGSVAPGRSITVALEQDIRPGWHTYWRNPGDAGQATEIHWRLPQGWSAGAIAWPYPKELPVGPLMDYGYEGRPWLLVDLTAPAAAKPGSRVVVRAAANWLVCKEICIPESADLVLPLSVSASPVRPDPAMAARFAAARARLPVASPWPTRFHAGKTLDLFVAAPKLADAQLTNVRFFPSAGDELKGIAPQNWSVAPDGLHLRLVPIKPGRLQHLAGVLVLQSEAAPTQALALTASPGAVPDFSSNASTGFALALAFAFLGGLILNLMPCVLPILAMKALAIAGTSGRAHKAPGEALAYGVGAVLSFAALGALAVGVRAGGQAIGWGFQLQQPLVVGLLALLMFAVGLNLSGVFEVPGFGAGEALARRGGHLGAFFTGVLAVVVAAPCTAPFMAAALGFALTQTLFVGMLIFVALGIGFATPFVVIGFSPGVQRLLPKPGAWMTTFRQVLAFPLYATALWLVWVLSFESGPDRLVELLSAALVLAFALWAFGKTQSGYGHSAFGRAAAAVGGAGCVALVTLLGASAHRIKQSSVTPTAQSYSQARLDMLRAQKRGVFVDATAAWCVTCLVNEKVALDDARVRSAFAARNVTVLVADWTNRDPQVTTLLSSHARSGVPLYLYYAPGASQAVVLPQILTPGTVLDALANS